MFLEVKKREREREDKESRHRSGDADFKLGKDSMESIEDVVTAAVTVVWQYISDINM